MLHGSTVNALLMARCTGDAGTPCGPCSKRERINACVYLEPSRKRQKTSPPATPSVEDASPQFDPRLEHITRDNNTNSKSTGNVVAFESAGVAARRGTHSADPTATGSSNSPTNTPEPGQAPSRMTQSRMLLSSKGEKRERRPPNQAANANRSSVCW